MDRILGLLALEPAGDDVFLAPTPGDGPGRLFGGQVASQSLRAATLCVPEDRAPHSLHAYFIRPGRPGVPLELTVERTRDGRSFTTRHVTARQEGEAIFNLTASFHVTEPGDDWQLPPPAEVPGPDDVAVPDDLISRFEPMSFLDLRPVNRPAPGGLPTIHPFWVRVRTRLPDDPALHTCVLTFMSDIAVVAGARAPTSTLPARFMGASLDHALWFHRPARADAWVLFSVEPVSNFGSRGLARGTMHTTDGTLVVSLSQEALLRGAGQVPLP